MVVDPQSLSQRELDKLLEELIRKGLDDSPRLHAAYAEWERREEQA